MSDYKMQVLEDEYKRQYNSVKAWIYIGIDTDRMEMAKIGLTTGELQTRATSSQNPFYTLLVAFKVKVGIDSFQIAQIERAVLTEVAKHYDRIDHYNTGRRSEWFYGDPYEIRDFVQNFLYNEYSKEMNSYYCHIRDQGFINGWENELFLYGKTRNPYQVSDISKPPENPDCYNYGGCGDTECEICGDQWFLKSRL
nr:GIY-YIG nuclease family protein [Moraxella sp. CTOTU48268]